MFCLSQYCCDAGENIAGNQKAKVMEEAIEAKDGKTETEDISESHDYRRGGAQVNGWETFMSTPKCDDKDRVVVCPFFRGGTIAVAVRCWPVRWLTGRALVTARLPD